MAIQLTADVLKKICPKTKLSVLAEVAKWINFYAPKYGVTTLRRMRYFVSQIAHESLGFYTTKEFASGAKYEGRKDLGNIYKGDGVKYKGRGYIQITGRYNYRDCGKDNGVDFLNHPELMETIQYAVLVSYWYWNKHNLNSLADKDEYKAVTRKINGGLNGLDSRYKYLNLCNHNIV